MSQLILERGATFRKSLIRRLVPSRLLEVSFSPYFLLTSLVLCVSLITVMTLMFSTSQITKGYEVDKLDAEQQGLIKEREIGDMKLSQVRALDAIRNSKQVQNMSRPNVVVYVVNTGNIVVSK